MPTGYRPGIPSRPAGIPADEKLIIPLPDNIPDTDRKKSKKGGLVQLRLAPFR
jgi:hypothetical protein